MSKDFQTAVRFPSEVVRRLDEIAEQMTLERPGVKVTRAAVIRMMVMEGLRSAKQARNLKGTKR